MKTTPSFSAILFLSLMLSAPAFAAPKSETPSKTNAVKANISALNDEAAYTQQLTDYYKKDAAESKKLWAQKTDLLKQVMSLREKMLSSQDAEEKKKLGNQILGINKQLGALSEEMAKKDIENAEFALTAAKRRLEKSKENMARIRESNKKLAG